LNGAIFKVPKEEPQHRNPSLVGLPTFTLLSVVLLVKRCIRKGTETISCFSRIPI